MIITKKAIPRRAVLRGVGAAFALPLLDAMAPALRAFDKTEAKPVSRFGAVYVPPPGGSYTGSSDNVSGAVDTNECATVLPGPYTFISANSATAVAGQAFTFTVETYGLPLAKIKDKGAIPVALHFVNNGNGTATIFGIPKPRKIGIHQMTFTATFGTGKTKHVATQSFTLDIT